jgi:hypothetical protein
MAKFNKQFCWQTEKPRIPREAEIGDLVPFRIVPYHQDYIAEVQAHGTEGLNGIDLETRY